ncbi:MAG: hypothetical protein ABI763_13420 [Bacteroidota bacterium]
MIRYIKHGEIDFQKWDATIDASTNGMVYAKSWFLDIVSPGWQALIEDDYTIVFPLTSRKKFGFSYLHQPFFTQQLGVFSGNELTVAKIDEFLFNVPIVFRLVEIQLNHSNKFNGGDFKISERLTHHLDLNRVYDIIQKNYSDNLKRNLKRANQQEVIFNNNFGTRDLINLFKANRGKEVETLKDRDYQTFEKLVEEGSKRNLVTKVGVMINHNLEAGAVFIKSNYEYIFLFSATGDKAKESGAMAYIIDDFIRSHAGETMQLDFEGSMDSGLARFYKSFGSKEIVYLQIRKNNLPLPLRWLK